jgi:hypothetical protein
MEPAERKEFIERVKNLSVKQLEEEKKNIEKALHSVVFDTDKSAGDEKMKEMYSEQEGIVNTFIYIRENPYSFTSFMTSIVGAKVNKSKNKSKKSKKTRKTKK